MIKPLLPALLLVGAVASAVAQQTPALPQARTQSEATDRATSGIKGLTDAQRRSDGALVIKGRLSGNGVIRGAGHRVIEGTVAPGNSPGCVTDQGNVTFTGSSFLEIEIGGPVPCSGYDRLTVGLVLTLQAPALKVALIDGFVPSAGHRFDILNWGTLTGTFGSLDLPRLPPGLHWSIAELYATGELVVESAEQDNDIPVPAWSHGLLALGLLAALVVCRRGTRG